MLRATAHAVFVLVLAALVPACEAGLGGSGLGPQEDDTSGISGNDGGAAGWFDGGIVSTGTDAQPASGEACDGFDDDGDGEVDEGCACTAGKVQACFPGAKSLLQGACLSGTQTCHGTAEFGVWGKCEGATLPATEVCGNGIDEDCDGKDTPCPGACTAGQTRSCYFGPTGTLGKGTCKAGTQTCTAAQAWGPCVGAVLPRQEACGNGIDEDCDGKDTPCPGACTPGQTRTCYFGPAGTMGKGTCKAGTQTCTAAKAWGACVGQVLPRQEVCGNGIDENCDGKDTPCAGQVVTVPVNINGDCVTASCPPQHPYPVGCNIKLDGGDNRGCVASSPTSSVVYFQEGDKCKKGKVQGVLYCSTKPGAPLNAGSCYINKSTKYYPSSKSGCPKTSG